MGADVDIYRCRIGLFVASRDSGVLLTSYITNFSKLVKIIGSVAFIRTLLVMAGVESNPGPDKFIFRYQYLLIEVGTQVLRKLFDCLVGNDFVQYLNANPEQDKQLEKLIDNKTLTAEQAKILPPIDNKPNTSNFDITLLACLLRNVCGLCDPNHSVWKSPAPGDPQLETDITKFRLCRNSLQHSTTVKVSEHEFQSKWDELVSILNSLNTVCGLANLTTLIDDAKIVEIDDELKNQLDKTFKEWVDMERLFDSGIEELKLGQSELKVSIMEGIEVQRETRDEVKTLCRRKAHVGQESTRKRFKAELSDSDVKECLKKSYLETCDKLQVSPLFSEDDEMNLLTIYQPPYMRHRPYHRDQETEGNCPISSYEDVFTKDRKSFRNIYITGDAGVGKTSFCQRMALLWSKSQSGDIINNKDVQNDVNFMRKFDFVFYVSLRDTYHTSIVKMIIDTFFSTNSKDIMEERVKLIENILCEKQCLIILDGFDEWTPTKVRNETRRLPRKIKSETCTYITSCRPFKIESVRLKKKEIDRQIQMTGICKKSTEKYIDKIVKYVNVINKDNKKLSDFLHEVRKCNLYDQLHIPIIASQLVVLWFYKRLTSMSRAVIYGNIVEMLLEKAVKEKNIESTSATTDEIKLPESFAEFKYLQKYPSLLEKVCSLSFRSLFQLDKNAAGLVFTEEQLMSHSITSEEINTLCKLGILSKNKVIGSFARQEMKISFIHKSYTEFLAALFVYSFDMDNSVDYIVNTWNSMVDVVPYKNFFIFLTGISCEKVKCLLENISPKISHEVEPEKFHFTGYIVVQLYQDIVLSCFKEANRSKTTNVALKLEHFVFYMISDDSSLLDLLLLNKKCVKSVRILFPRSDFGSDVSIIVTHVFIHIKDSELEHLVIDCKFSDKLDNNTMKILTSTVKTLPCIKSLTLCYVKLSDDVLLQLHPDVKQVNIRLSRVTMSCQWFRGFVDSCVNNKSEIKVELYGHNLTSVGRETHSGMSHDVKYMPEHLETLSATNITQSSYLPLRPKSISY